MTAGQSSSAVSPTRTPARVEHGVSTGGRKERPTRAACEEAAPPKWKMAIITSVVIYPLLFLMPALLALLALVIGDAPKWFASLLNVAVTIPLMTWILTPAATKLLAGWLYEDGGDTDPPRG